MTAGDIIDKLDLTLDGLDATNRLAARLADMAAPGLVVLLEGPVGAGKTHIARATIQALLQRHGTLEDVPSPTFTLVQTYDTPDLEIWHADLYRLTNPDELIELGLEAAFQSGFCLVEWPDRMAPLPAGQRMIRISLTPGAAETTRHATLTSTGLSLSPLAERGP